MRRISGGCRRPIKRRSVRSNCLDYDDLLVMLRQLLLLDEAARTNISRQYRYILVDEYQDTNRLQAEVIRQLATTHQNVMVVGDDSQSIYAFRGATFKNIMDFPVLFPGRRSISWKKTIAAPSRS